MNCCCSDSRLALLWLLLPKGPRLNPKNLRSVRGVFAAPGLTDPLSWLPWESEEVPGDKEQPRQGAYLLRFKIHYNA